MIKTIVNKLSVITRYGSIFLQGIAVAVLTLMMFLTAADVLMRNILDRPIVGSHDLTELMMAVIIGFLLAYTSLKDGHVNIELFYNRFPLLMQKGANIFTSSLSIVLSICISWQSFNRMADLAARGNETPVLLIPVYPFAGVIGFGFAMLALVLIVELLKLTTGTVKE